MVPRKPLNDLLGQKVDYTCVPKPEVISWNVGILELWNGGSKNIVALMVTIKYAQNVSTRMRREINFVKFVVMI